MQNRSERDQRIAEIDTELESIRERLHALSRERAALVTTNAREDWPDGPFILRYWMHHAQESDEYDTPLEAVRAATAMEDYGSGSPEEIIDRTSRTIYDFSNYSYQCVADGYPEP